MRRSCKTWFAYHRKYQSTRSKNATRKFAGTKIDERPSWQVRENRRPYVRVATTGETVTRNESNRSETVETKKNRTVGSFSGVVSDGESGPIVVRHRHVVVLLTFSELRPAHSCCDGHGRPANGTSSRERVDNGPTIETDRSTVFAVVVDPARTERNKTDGLEHVLHANRGRPPDRTGRTWNGTGIRQIANGRPQQPGGRIIYFEKFNGRNSRPRSTRSRGGGGGGGQRCCAAGVRLILGTGVRCGRTESVSGRGRKWALRTRTRLPTVALRRGRAVTIRGFAVVGRGTGGGHGLAAGGANAKPAQRVDARWFRAFCAGSSTPVRARVPFTPTPLSCARRFVPAAQPKGVDSGSGPPPPTDCLKRVGK